VAQLTRVRAPTQLERAATVSGANEREQDNYAQLLLQLEASIGQARCRATRAHLAGHARG
jgi:hypothetical protein